MYTCLILDVASYSESACSKSHMEVTGHHLVSESPINTYTKKPLIPFVLLPRVTFAKISDTDWNITENEHTGKEIGESLKNNKAIFNLHVGIIIIWAQLVPSVH